MRRLALLALAALIPTAHADDWLYLTYPGDTPLKIGREYLRDPADWKTLLKLNQVRNEYVLPVNTRLRIPVELLKVTPAPVEVVHVEGNVRVRPADGTFRKLAVGDRLTGGETVLTGPRSFAAYRLADASKLSQQASSKLTFGRLAAYGKTGMVATELDLENGRIEAGASRQVGPAGGFRVRTPVAVAGLRGTAFRLNVSDDGKLLRNEVLEGAVGVAAEGAEVLVAGGQGTVAELGKPPEPPRPLLPAPATGSLPGRVIDLPLAFAWQDMAGAQAWRAQVAADAGFERILLDDQGKTPEVRWETSLPDGHYFLRLRAVDGAGLEGLNADHPFELDARPLPPKPMAPASGERSYKETVAFGWAAAEEAHGYLLQIAPDGDFAPGRAVERRLPPLLSHAETLAPGEYRWRIASLDEAGQPHGWGPAAAFRVQPLPSPPKTEVRTENGLAAFAWSPAAGAASYDLEVARKPDFGTADARVHTVESQASASLKPGKYHWRIRALEGDGQAGAWSRPNPLLIPPEAPHDIHVGISDGALSIRWQGNATAYRLEFARDAEYRQPLFNHRETSNQTRLVAPEPGQYWVRIIALSETGAQGSASKPIPFTVRRWQ